MEIRKVESIWLAAAVNTYETCKTNPDWKLSDVYFEQFKIVSDAKNIIKDEVPATMVSQQCCAYTSYSVYRYLVARNKLRRISYDGEFGGYKERPEFDKSMIIETSHGRIECRELYRFVDEEFSPAIKQKLHDEYNKYNVKLIFQYLEDYIGKQFIAVEKAAGREVEMEKHKEKGRAARTMLSNISKEIISFMPKYSKADTSAWINQRQRVDHYIWSELRKSGQEESPSSMSIFVEENADELQLRISVEIRDSKAKAEDYSRHNRLLEKPNTNPELKYFIDGSLPNALVVSTLNNEDLKKEVASGKHKKVQICKVISRDEVLKKSGKEVLDFITNAIEELEPFYNLAVGGKSTTETEKSQEDIADKLDYKTNFDKNIILYGPPGTGKTYHTVLYALAICENTSIEALEEEAYIEVLDRFNQRKKEGQISFTAFHQSYGYEEFIEGIRPVISKNDDVDDGDIKYEYVDGIFKEFCLVAGKVKIKSPSLGMNENPIVWNVLLDGPGESELKKECFDNNYIKIGWKGHEDIITEESSGLSAQTKRTLLNFQDEMKIGDIVLVQKSNSSIDGIGVITSDYRFEKGKDFPRTRDVRWIKTGIDENILLMNKNTRLGRKSIYPLHRISIGNVMPLIKKYTSNDDINIEKDGKPYVFIIDEINRGNISKIFGELITLIEKTKRVGEDEEIKVILPYTGDEFGVPANVYLLGTMNTADRSIALIDTALRRRFKFIEMLPDSSVLKKIGADKILSENGTKELDIALMLDTMNQRIESLFDREHTIGHAFFTDLKDNPTIEMLAKIFFRSIIPLLQEYFYEDYSKIQLVLGDNGKKDDKYKFILDSPVKIMEMFNGNPDLDLPDKKYTIQEKAFYQIESYLQITKVW